MVLPVPLLRLQCGVNSYEWGKKGDDSAAARFAAATPSDDLVIEADKPYAEVSISRVAPRVDYVSDKRPAVDGQSSF